MNKKMAIADACGTTADDDDDDDPADDDGLNDDDDVDAVDGSAGARRAISRYGE